MSSSKLKQALKEIGTPLPTQEENKAQVWGVQQTEGSCTIKASFNNL